MLQTTIVETLSQLPESLQEEVLHYAEFLADRYQKSTPSVAINRRGGLGAWKGKIKMSEDFDAPLDDECDRPFIS